MIERAPADLLTRLIRQRVPHAWVGDVLALLRILMRVLGSYTRGVLLESIVVGIMTSLGYFLIGLEIWLPLGVIAVVGELVPIIGPGLAFLISLPLILVTQPDRAVLALGLFVVVQILGGLLVAPRIHGGAMHFTWWVALILLAVGGAVAGPIGMILALPAAALLRDVSFYTSYRASGLSPAAALRKLPLFHRQHERRAPAPVGTALPPS